MSNNYFYKKLKREKIALADLFQSESVFHTIPKDWHIILVDLENSTQAVKNGFHQDVNFAATGSIVAVLNCIKTIDEKVTIPYFFGGDGATFIIPNAFLTSVMEVLEKYRLRILNLNGFNLKVGAMQIQEIYAKNLNLKIAKIAITPYLVLPTIFGDGLKYAEKKIKNSFVRKNKPSEKTANSESINLNGMECRWQEIKAPSTTKKIICLLADAPNEALQLESYSSILKQLDLIFGNFSIRQPLSSKTLLLDLSFKKIKREMVLRLGRYNSTQHYKNWFLTIMGKYFFKYFKEGKSYLDRVTKLSHTMMMDGTINTIFSGTQEQIDAFITFMDTLESEGKITYGIHITHASIMSCYVEDMKTNHNHFVDGTKGGFTNAAIMIKAKKLEKQKS